ncbi:hypothetical protein ACQEU8_35820 [Streptomyces sp. CA-250714]|uniref:hypothetical protein n=1 Tax=Streptomyces sp. CA-250714 TaxID=3240060 RepID=UPI003D8F1D08
MLAARPETYDAATRAALEHIDGQAVRAVADGRPERTRRGYAQDWTSWSRFCAASGVPLLAVTSGTLVMFVEWLWEQPGQAGTAQLPRPALPLPRGYSAGRASRIAFAVAVGS